MDFLRSYLLSLALNIYGLLPAALLVVARLLFGLSLWWAAGAVALWMLGVLVRMLVVTWAARCGDTPLPYQENKNPYSVGQDKKNPHV